MFATDFPHIECDWPNTRPFAERLFAGVPADEAFKIAAVNTLTFFGLRDYYERYRDEIAGAIAENASAYHAAMTFRAAATSRRR
jgi:hypothetical protein